MVTQEYSLPPPKTALFLAWISLIGSLFIFGLKGLAYSQTNSGGVLSDALESLIDIISCLITLKIMKIVTIPADENHPYGHGKLEYFSAAFEGGLITFAAILISFGATQALVFGSQIVEVELDLGLVLMIATVLINGGLSLYLYRHGTAIKSQAIVAKSQHILADLVTTVAVIIGLGLVKLTGHAWIDSVAALVVAAHLAREGWRIIRQAVGGLIDEVDEEALKELAKTISAQRQIGIINIYHLKLIRSGRFHHIDAHIILPEHWSVQQVHTITQEFEKKILSLYSYDGEIAFHVWPCHREYCRSCELEACPVRRQSFVKQRPFTAEGMIKPSTKDEYLHWDKT